MKRILSIFITLFFATEVYADTLNSVINKVYGKGSEKAETYLQNVLDVQWISFREKRMILYQK